MAETSTENHSATRVKRFMDGQCPTGGNWLTMEERIERWCLACDRPFEAVEASPVVTLEGVR